ncbi:MAG: hypothetical protein ACE5GA_01210 [Candidatus Zixiibacteriota bacterium]
MNRSKIKSSTGALAFLALISMALHACSDDDSNPTGGGGGGTAPTALTYDAFVRPLFLSRCNGSACHVNQSQNGFNVTTYTGLLAGGTTLGSGIVAMSPNTSNVYLKLLSNTPVPPRMPSGGPFLPQSTIDSIAMWITAGAPEN